MYNGVSNYRLDHLALDELLQLQAPAMARALTGISSERKEVLLVECEQRIWAATVVAASIGQQCTDHKKASRWLAPYTLVKKYSHLYTCIAGWQTKKDLEERTLEAIMSSYVPLGRRRLK